jgi:hypothetical protein
MPVPRRRAGTLGGNTLSVFLWLVVERPRKASRPPARCHGRTRFGSDHLGGLFGDGIGVGEDQDSMRFFSEGLYPLDRVLPTPGG